MAVKQFFSHLHNMLIYANFLKNSAVDFNFFYSPKDAYLILRQLQIKEGKKFYVF